MTKLEDLGGMQAVQAAQITFEDYFMADLNIAPLKIVGWEGVFGTLIMVCVLLPIVYFVPGTEGNGFHENSIETLHVRMERHCANAQTVAEFLAADPRVAWVSYAGLESSPYRALARKYMPGGAGAVFTFGVKGGYEAGIKLVESVGLFSHLANIGDTRSLILHPASTTHRQLTEEQRLAAGAGPDVIRLSIGLETAADLIADLNRALG